MQKLLFIRILTVGVSLFLSFLSRGAHADDSTFRIGVIAPLTGPLAEYGAAVRNGIELARASGAPGLSHLSFLYEDDQYDGKRTVLAFNKLRQSDGVHLVYLWGTGPAHAVAPIAESHSFPLVIMSIDPAPALNRRWVMRFANYSEQYISTLLSYLRAHGVKSIGIIRTELGYTNSMVEALSKNLLPGETMTEVATLQPGEMELKSVIARLQGKRFDALGVYLMSGQIARFYTEAKDRFTAPLTFGTDFFESMTEVRSAGAAINGAVFPNNAVEPWFLERYRKAYGNDIQITFAANAYDFALLGADTFGKRPPSPRDAAAIRSALRAVTSRRGASGEFAFKESEKGGQYFEFPIVIRKVRDGQIETEAMNRNMPEFMNP